VSDLILAIQCGIECIEAARDKELIDACRHKLRGHAINEASCEYAAESLQNNANTLRKHLFEMGVSDD